MQLLSLKDKTIVISNLLKKQVGIIPTDTVYGIVGLYRKNEVRNKIQRLKQQPVEKPIAIIVSSIKMAKDIGIINFAAFDLWKKYLPGTLTLIVFQKKNPELTVAIRITNDPWLKSIINVTGPLFASSANKHHESPITRVAENKLLVDFIVDGGVICNQPSTIIDTTKDDFLTIRQ